MNDPEKEREANIFAMCLLMPEEFVREEIKMMRNFDFTRDEDVKTLAKKFQVSVAMMGARIAQIFSDHL